METRNQKPEKSAASGTGGSPWQYEWKQPQWHVVQDGEESTSYQSTFEDVREGITLCMTSAHVSHEELPEALRLDRSDVENNTTIDEENDDKSTATDSDNQQKKKAANASATDPWSSLVLTVTVVASPFCTSHDDFPSSSSSSYNESSASSTISSVAGDLVPSGDLLVLEIVRQPGPNGLDASSKQNGDSSRGGENDDEEEETKNDEENPTAAEPQRILWKVLRWPGVALQENLARTANQDDDENNQPSWRQFLPGWLGGTPRSSQRSFDNLNNDGTAIGVVAACLCRRLMDEDIKQAEAFDALDTMTFLSLGMDPEVGNHQSASKAQSEGAGDDNDADTSSENLEQKDQDVDVSTPVPDLVLACLCSDGSIHVYSPWKLLERSLTAKADLKKKEQDDAFHNSMSAFLLGDYVFEQLQSNIWPLSQPESTIKLTVPIRKKGNTNHLQDSSTTAGPSSEEADGKAEGGKVSLWDKELWNPNVDPFTAIYRTVNNVPTHCISAFEYIVIAGRGRRVKRRGDGSSRKGGRSAFLQGGFLTLLSLRHFSEIRTLYLPFSPTSLSPFIWGGMKFVFVIGDRGIAVAIRIDISMHNSVVCGEAPKAASHDPNDPIIPTVSSDHSLLSHQSALSATTEREKQKKPRCFIHRFQILPVILPDTITDETEAISIAIASLFGSSPFTSPPSMALVCRNPTKSNVIVMRRTLESVDYVRPTLTAPSCRLFRGYRRSRDRRILAIDTAFDPRHVAQIKASPAEGTADAPSPALGIASPPWCYVGQVSAKTRNFHCLDNLLVSPSPRLLFIVGMELARKHGAYIFYLLGWSNCRTWSLRTSAQPDGRLH